MLIIVSALTAAVFSSRKKIVNYPPYWQYGSLTDSDGNELNGFIPTCRPDADEVHDNLCIDTITDFMGIYTATTGHPYGDSNTGGNTTD